jgi:hypothetical protein
MKVDLPAPGAPEMPTRIALPVCGSSAASTCSARAWWSRRVDSTSVMAFASARDRLARQHAVDQLLVGGGKQRLAMRWRRS